ncbi:hypothetical protein ACIP93_33875 [Streptomyces sp. NPDC088745]|uniref:hypothetical protein n=1 Tax=Streptomyces sp. NPDC088745 TaxID=3365884 RepID=UPI003815FAFA
MPPAPPSAAQWNARYPVGTVVTAYPGARPERAPGGPRLDTRTRSAAWTLPHGGAVVLVDGRAGALALTHVDPRPAPGEPA